MEATKKFTLRVLKAEWRGLRPYSTQLPALLSDINLLDLTRVIAGPYCTQTIADLGANVIKIESLEGDEARKWGPPFIDNTTESYYFTSVNRNKKSICVDFKKPEGKQIIYDLAKKCDVLVENYIPGKLDQWEVGYEKLSRINHRLIYCAITGFGHVGPYAQKPGYDVIAAAMGGLLGITGERNGRPVKVGVAMTDLATGLHAFGAIMTALHYRNKTGKGQKIDCNLLSTQIACMINVSNIYLNCGIEGQKWGTAHANIVPYQAFPTSDGEIVIGANSNPQFRDLCKLIGREEMITDHRFKDNADRVQNRELLIQNISEATKKKTKKEWWEIFKQSAFAVGPVNTIKEVFEDEHVKAIGTVKELPHPVIGSIKTTAPPTVYSEGGNFARTAPPLLGEHTKEILTDFLGYNETQIESLYDGKVVR
ncbi:succinate--hydroxymethylglutarate CoA-transferase-like [Hyposmocoma kahamanoa]|uniref:succinate--hydroxymethylglutarate CoA-transferase-like n=1 Tax=Hyposmocoma kahamanoa TaxID=1477025 RepID=UPI000E6DA3D0|nr:succinate--hydroxymethylglutarate CoA-transferase-like [Hyposmocoma kahamanoa]